MKKKNGERAEHGIQYAALPWRLAESVEILLATSRDTRRWVIPKGWPLEGRKPHATAAVEALQEAGILGKIDKTALGSYRYQKRQKNGSPLVPGRRFSLASPAPPQELAREKPARNPVVPLRCRCRASIRTGS